MSGFQMNLVTGEPVSSRINWLDVCKNPSVDAVITEPCPTLTSPDGYTLTPQGQSTFQCIAWNGLLDSVDSSYTTTVAAQALGLPEGCKGSARYYTTDEIIQCNSLIPKNDVVGPGGLILDNNGSPTTFTCNDLLQHVQMSAGDMIGNITNNLSFSNASLTEGNVLTDTGNMNPDLGLDLAYPQGWSSEPGSSTFLVAPEGDSAFLSFLPINENPSTDLASLADRDIADFRGNGTLSTIKKTNNIISGNPALSIHFNFKWAGMDKFYEYQITYINFGDRLYKFEYYAVGNELFLKYLNEVNKVITSASLRQ